MSIRVGINGFGRIGRLFFRVLAKRTSEFQVVGINDLTNPEHLRHMLRYDSTHGRFDGTVEVDGANLVVNGQKIPVLSERDPAKLPWAKLEAEYVAECSGIFTSPAEGGKAGFDSHLVAGAKKVLVSAPAKGAVHTVVMGVNDKTLKAEHNLISNASCTTNCTAPIMKVINEKFKIVRGMVTTVHGYTNDQRILDAIHSDLRRARTAAQNIIPTTTGMSKAIAEVLPELKGKIEGTAIRVPVSDGSLIDCSLLVEKSTTVEEVNATLKEYANGALKGILDFTMDPIVSSDILDNPHSSIADGLGTMVQGGNLIKVISWYDNEWGFSNRMADLIKHAKSVSK
ncbi:MAG: type I glyceraldehyde-3-phosphate dehydrogenase [Planctomycetota bacterium]